MNPKNRLIDENSFPFVAFKIHEEDYCIASNVVSQMIIITDIKTMPKNPPCLLGILNVRGVIYPIIDLRILFDVELLETEINSFYTMKQAHLDWVIALERSVKEDVPFTMARDPHQCKFGQWFYSYRATDENIISILNDIEEPHQKLHDQAGIVEKFLEDGNHEEAKAALNIAENICHKEIVPLLDQMIDAYRSMNRGMVILVEHEDTHVGLSVDTVTSIEHFEGCIVDNASLQFSDNDYIKNVIISHSGKIFLEIDYKALLDLQEEFTL